LREFLGKADVSHDARETGDDPRRLDPPYRVNGTIRGGTIRGGEMCGVRCHGCPVTPLGVCN
jgi:hypothetical protein